MLWFGSHVQGHTMHAARPAVDVPFEAGCVTAAGHDLAPYTLCMWWRHARYCNGKLRGGNNRQTTVICPDTCKPAAYP